MQIKTANGKKILSISRSEWEAIGKKAGWDEKLQPGDVVEGDVLRMITTFGSPFGETWMVVRDNTGAEHKIAVWTDDLKKGDRVRVVIGEPNRAQSAVIEPVARSIDRI